MTLAITTQAGVETARRTCLSPQLACGLLSLVIVAATLAGFLSTAPEAAAQAQANAGADLTRLLRAMTALKILMVAGVTSAVFWRLRAPAPLTWLVAYAATCGLMWAGPGSIWSLAHIKAGAVMLHAGLFGAVVALWRDPVVAERLARIVSARRAELARMAAATRTHQP